MKSVLFGDAVYLLPDNQFTKLNQRIAVRGLEAKYDLTSGDFDARLLCVISGDYTHPDATLARSFLSPEDLAQLPDPDVPPKPKAVLAPPLTLPSRLYSSVRPKLQKTRPKTKGGAASVVQAIAEIYASGGSVTETNTGWSIRLADGRTAHVHDWRQLYQIATGMPNSVFPVPQLKKEF